MSRQNNGDAIDSAEIVIVGNGIAGLTAAVEARRLEPEKSIVIMTSQSHPTINTPALKQFAIGKLTREQLLAYPAGTERQQCIHVVNAHVEEIRAQESYLCLSGGRGFGYGSLLLATGSCPTGLPSDLPGQDFDGVLTLHRLNDYLDLRRRLIEVEEAVVIGGGSHAIETVMGLLYLGIQVHWLIRSETFLPRMMDRPASDLVLEGTRRAGAKVYTETEMVGIVGRVGVVAGVVTNQQQMLPCQLVLVCTGTAPLTTLAQHCDIPMKYQQGILVDDQLRTSVRNIYAAGDVAALRDPLTGKYAPRAQWYAAVLQGRAVATLMTGKGEPEGFGVPWHATRLGELSILTVGNPLDMSEYITPLTERRKGSYCRLSLVDDRLVGYLSLGSRQPDSLAIKRLIDEGLSVREIKKDLLRGEFDARKYFSGKRTYAVQRMISTGQLPTPLPPMPGIIGGERQARPRVSEPGSPLQRRAQMPGHPQEPGQKSASLPRMPAQAGPPLHTGAQRAVPPTPQKVPGLPDTEPLVHSASSSRQVPRPAPAQPKPFLTDERRERVAAQITWTGIGPAVRPASPPANRRGGQRDADWLNEGPPPASQSPAQGVTEDLAHDSSRQFVKFPARSEKEEESNPHPTRSLWHYTDKHPAVKGKKNVQK
jgi:NADPH-dependent 2,4-dienoyl-CoA reductase/sulfur reductase-like enzyme